MKKLYPLLIIFLSVLSALAQEPNPTGADLCQEGRLQYVGRLFANPRARVQYPGDGAIDVTYYGLDLTITHTPAYLRGSATISLKSTSDNLTSFYLDLQSANGSLRVDSVKAGGQRLTFLHQSNRLTITPPAALRNGQALTLTVYYQGVPGSSGFGSFAFSTHGPSNDPVIWSLSEPYGASDWFPCKDTPADKADSSSVSITAPAQFVSVSNGTLISLIPNPDGTRTYRWHNRYPIAQYLISVAMSNYTRYDTPFQYAPGQIMPVTHYLYPESMAANQANLDQTSGMLRVFSQLFGPYPFLQHKYGHAQFGWGGGMEHQTISSMGAFNTNLIAHELAHQWFGDKITCRDWHNIWLNEGFASYAEALYQEAIGGRVAYNNYIANFMTNARRALGTLYVKDISTVNSIFNSNRTYSKGAVVLHMLRGVVGDSTFVRILRTYSASPRVAYSTAVTDDFQAIAEQVYGQKLDYFFKEWIYGESHPSYKVTYEYKGVSENRHTVQVRLEQAVNTNPTSFTMPVQLRVQSAAGDTTVTVFNDQASQVFTVPAKGQPTGVVLDPNNWILKSIPVEYNAIITGLPQPEPTVLTVFPNPTAETLTVAFSTLTPGTCILSLVSPLGQVISTQTDSQLSPGRHTRTVPVRGFSPGRYVLTIQSADGPQSAAVLVQ
ncbi:M1 family aminopeptidase [Nibrella saemangeumensis]|uniref:Aminopeptidase N n=1 Tax=Nibrella saemangeumensis TaxID=1084526 RepID=A0ABP8MMS4_9BACT